MHALAHVRPPVVQRSSPRFAPRGSLDLGQLTEATHGARFDVCQLGAGALEGELATISLDAASVTAGQVGVNVGLRGVFPGNAPTIVLIQAAPPGLLVNGYALAAGDLLRCPPAARIDAALPASTRWLALQANRDYAHAANRLGQREVAAVRPVRRARERLQDYAAELLATARTAPALLTTHAAGASAVRTMTSLLQDGLSCGRPVGPAPSPSSLRRRNALRLACDAMLDNLERPLSIDSLCAVADVSPRALTYYFKQMLGVSPMAWYRAHRFAAARRSLLRGDATLASVTAVALRFGFRHLGRFSVEYRALFQELPSETLARSRLGAGRSEHARRRPAVRTRRARALTA